MPPGNGSTSSSWRTDNLAIASLICGIMSLVCCVAAVGIALGPAATTMGVIARRRIAASGGGLGGAWLADIGLVFGMVGFVASFAALYVYLFHPIPCITEACYFAR